MPNSLGMFYATFTSILGYKPDSDEWKVMAMSGYNYDCKEYITKLRKTYKLLKNGEKKRISQDEYNKKIKDLLLEAVNFYKTGNLGELEKVLKKIIEINL